MESLLVHVNLLTSEPVKIPYYKLMGVVDEKSEKYELGVRVMRAKPTQEQFQLQLQAMIATLKERIIAGDYKQGDYLPSEKRLAAEFGMSNNSIRQGLEVLVKENWIEKIERVGNRVMTTKTPVTLKLACNDNMLRNISLDGLLTEFQRKFPWITVQVKIVSSMPGQTQGRLDDEVDVMLINDYQFCTLMETGKLDWLETVDTHPGIYPSLNSKFMNDDQLYAVPIVFTPVVLAYNKRHFGKFGIAEPHGGWTWDDLLHAAELLASNGVHGIYFHLPDMNRWPIFLLQSGEHFEWEGTNARSILNTRLLEGIRVCKRVVQNRRVYPYYMSQGNIEVGRLFEEEKVSMIITSYMGMNTFNNASLEYDIAPLPYIHDPRTLQIIVGGAINKISRHKEEAKCLIDYFTSYEGQYYIRQHTLSIPALQRLSEVPVESHVANMPSRYSLFREMIFSYRSHRDLNVPQSKLRFLFDELKAYWGNLIDEEELCRRIQHALSLQTPD